MGMDRQDLAKSRVGRRRVKAKLSLHAGEARTPSGGSRGWVVATVAVALLGLAACGGRPGASPSDASPAVAAAAAGPTASPASAAAPQTLTETGSSLMAPLFTRWAPAYHSRFSQVTLRTVTASSGQGISSAAAGTADIGASDAYLSSATLAKYAGLVNIPLAVAALMVV